MRLRVWYKEGFVDCYTVQIGSDVFGMGKDATSPLGFNQYVGSMAEYSQNNFGKEVNLTDLPWSTLGGILDRLEEYGSAAKEECSKVQDALEHYQA